MKLPTEGAKSFVLEMRQSLLGSMAQRAKDAQNWDAIFFAGSIIDKDIPAILNIVPSRIRTQAGNLFSPDRLTMRIEYGMDMSDEATLEHAQAAGTYLSRELREADADLEFGDAVELALRHGCAFGQLTWEGKNFCCDVVQSSAVGVLNERAKTLDEQPAFMVSYSIPVEDFQRTIKQFRGTDDIAKAFDGQQDTALHMNDATKVILGLNQPIGSASPSQAGFINLLPRPPYIPSANSKGRQLSLDAIWLKQDDGRWATVYVVEGAETIGTDQWRNFLAVDEHGEENPHLAKRHPYFYVCPYPVKGAFFGRSAIADMAEVQGFLRRHSADLDHILDMQSDPAHIGYGAIQTAETYKQNLRTPGGWVTESGPNAKVTAEMPEMPPQLLQAIEAAASWASDAANQPPVVQGRGEQGVRAGAHAETLLGAASARERRAAARVVRQCGDMGDLALDILRVKDAATLKSNSGEFLLESLPDDYHVYCNGHTASPLFAAEHQAIVWGLAKEQSIGPDEVLDMLNPEGYDLLKQALRKRQQQQQQLVQSLPPEDRVKVITGHAGKKR